MLRAYEARGFLAPARTDGGTRRYSHDDVELIGRVAALLASGLNFKGARQVLELEDETARLRSEITDLRDQLP
jgi:DNA-binding transcriptional MerR regulator